MVTIEQTLRWMKGELEDWLPECLPVLPKRMSKSPFFAPSSSAPYRKMTLFSLAREKGT